MESKPKQKESPRGRGRRSNKHFPFRAGGNFLVKYWHFHHWQCDQMAKLFFFNISPFTAIKIDQRHTQFAKVGPEFCQIRNNPAKYCQRRVRFCQRGEISPNLVALIIGRLTSLGSSSGEGSRYKVTYLPRAWQCTQSRKLRIWRECDLITLRYSAYDKQNVCNWR